MRFTPRPRIETSSRPSVSIFYGSKILSIDSQKMLKAIKTRKIPLKSPERVSTLPKPYVYYLSAGSLAM